MSPHKSNPFQNCGRVYNEKDRRWETPASDNKINIFDEIGNFHQNIKNGSQMSSGFGAGGRQGFQSQVSESFNLETNQPRKENEVKKSCFAVDENNNPFKKNSNDMPSTAFGENKPLKGSIWTNGSGHNTGRSMNNQVSGTDNSHSGGLGKSGLFSSSLSQGPFGGSQQSSFGGSG